MSSIPKVDPKLKAILKIGKDVERLENQIAYAYAKIKELRKVCPHPLTFVKETPHADTGYAEPTKYWSSFVCVNCGDRWEKYYA